MARRKTSLQNNGLPTAGDLIALNWRLWQLGIEAQMVMGLRMTGLAGFWVMPKGESQRMVSEKPKAFATGLLAMQKAMLSGATMAAVTQAGLAPLSRRVHSNRRRLSRL